jgi:hypothetical protein
LDTNFLKPHQLHCLFLWRDRDLHLLHLLGGHFLETCDVPKPTHPAIKTIANLDEFDRNAIPREDAHSGIFHFVDHVGMGPNPSLH